MTETKLLELNRSNLSVSQPQTLPAQQHRLDELTPVEGDEFEVEVGILKDGVRSDNKKATRDAFFAACVPVDFGQYKVTNALENVHNYPIIHIADLVHFTALKEEVTRVSRIYGDDVLVGWCIVDDDVTQKRYETGFNEVFGEEVFKAKQTQALQRADSKSRKIKVTAICLNGPAPLRDIHHPELEQIIKDNEGVLAEVSPQVIDITPTSGVNLNGGWFTLTPEEKRAA